LPGKAARFTRKRGRFVARVAFAVPAAAFGLVIYSYLTLPDVRPLASSNPSTTAFIEIRADEARAHGKPPRNIHQWIAYRRISPSLKRAVLVAEDAAFWQHDGVDYDELQKSIEVDWARGQLVRGASTITQQLAKNLYLSPSRNPLRKLRELIIARRLEAELDKARILELYLNLIEWGDGIYGAEAASRAYFGESAATLGPAASALLAGAIVNPRALNPAHPTPRLQRRQQIILKRMGGVAPPVPARPIAPADDESALATPAEERNDVQPQDVPSVPAAPPPFAGTVEPK